MLNNLMIGGVAKPAPRLFVPLPPVLIKKQHHISCVLLILFIFLKGFLPENEERYYVPEGFSLTLASDYSGDQFTQSHTGQHFDQKESLPEKKQHKIKTRCKGSEVYFDPLAQGQDSAEQFFPLRPFVVFSKDPHPQDISITSFLRGPPVLGFS